MRQKFLSIALAGALLFSMTASATAAASTSELEAAAAYVRERGIMVGDQNGNLNLDTGLNRAQLAVILTRLSDDTGDMGRNAAYYRTVCPFIDVPEWAMPYTGYCAEKNLMSGYGNRLFGPNDAVIPAAACTVMLRVCGIADGEGSIWSYGTACSYAVGLGWIDDAAAHANIITRGEMAVLIYRAQTGARPGVPPSTGNGFLSNGKPVTEENVLELLRQLERDWPYGTVWGTHHTPGTRKNEVPSTAANRVMDVYWVSEYYGCTGYVSMVSSLIFGDKTNPGRKLDDLTEMRPGDMVFVVSPDGNVGHAVIALESPNQDGRFHYTDGNHGEIITWPSKEHPDLRSYSLTGFSGGRVPHHLEVWTRYPESVPFTGKSVEAWPTAPNS